MEIPNAFLSSSQAEDMDDASSVDKYYDNNIEIKEERIIPDGGFDAWMSVVGGFVINFVCLGALFSFGIFTVNH
jgi:hypothetical protein